MPEEAVLKIGGVSYGGWTSIRVNMSLSQVAGTFELELTEKYPAEQQKYEFKLGESCSVLLDGQTVITGYIDTISPSYDEGSHGISVGGRDKTADLADCSHVGPPSQWKGQTLEQITRDVCRPFDIPVVFEAHPTLKFDERTNEGDKVLPFLVKLSRLCEVLPVSYGDGRLVFTRSGSNPTGGGVIEKGGNVKIGQASFSNLERYSQYIVKGQGTPAAGLTAEQMEEYYQAYFSPMGRAEDNIFGGRYRPLVIICEVKGNPGYFEARARWEAAVRAGQSRKLIYTVAGWGPEPGGLWRINALAKVKDDFLGVDGSYLIEGVTYIKNENAGTIAQLTLVHPDTYKAEPVANPGKYIDSTFDAEY